MPIAVADDLLEDSALALQNTPKAETLENDSTDAAQEMTPETGDSVSVWFGLTVR